MAAQTSPKAQQTPDTAIAPLNYNKVTEGF